MCATGFPCSAALCCSRTVVHPACSRPQPPLFCRYFTPEEAIEYGIIDRVVAPTDEVAIEARDYEGMLRSQQSQQRGSRFAGAGAGGGAEAGM